MRYLFHTKLLIQNRPVDYVIYQKSILLYYAEPAGKSRDVSPGREFYIVKDDERWVIWDDDLAEHEQHVGSLIEQFFGVRSQ